MALPFRSFAAAAGIIEGVGSDSCHRHGRQVRDLDRVDVEEMEMVGGLAVAVGRFWRIIGRTFLIRILNNF